MYDSNEDLYAKLKSGGVNYDVIIPSDYMAERLKNEGLLQKLDYSVITNYEGIGDEYKNLFFDENNEYTVAYTGGMVGLIYNTTMVSEKPDSWSVMWIRNIPAKFSHSTILAMHSVWRSIFSATM